MFETQAPVAGADPRAWREMADEAWRLGNDRAAQITMGTAGMAARVLDYAAALRDAAEAVERDRTDAERYRALMASKLARMQTPAAAARGAEGERERERGALREALTEIHGIAVEVTGPWARGVERIARTALSAPRPSAGPAAPHEDVADLVAMSPLANLIRRRAHYVLRQYGASFALAYAHGIKSDDLERVAGVIAVVVCMDGTLRDAMHETLADASPAARASDGPAREVGAPELAEKVRDIARQLDPRQRGVLQEAAAWIADPIYRAACIRLAAPAAPEVPRG